jgi:hypothetical protein
MKLISVLTPQEKAALGVRPKLQAKALPARLAGQKGFISPKLLTFESMVERNRIGSELRRWMRQTWPDHRFAAEVLSENILDHAGRRVMHFKEKPLEALATSAAIHLHLRAFGSQEDSFKMDALKASAVKALEPHVGAQS